jgi:CRISPR system Cascade subunit CasD
MQSWGSRSRFKERDTEREPTKSGIVGLLCAALGRGREAPLSDLAALRMGVRVDQEGQVERDYQTALDVRKADPRANTDTVVSDRFFLSDAVFLVGLESRDLAVLRSLQSALERPRWPLYLGRKAFVPGEPVRLQDGVREGASLVEALASYAFLAGGYVNPADRLRCTIECEPGEDGEVRSDVPLSFASDDRRFGVRRVRTDFVPRPARTLSMEDACSSPGSSSTP